MSALQRYLRTFHGLPAALRHKQPPYIIHTPWYQVAAGRRRVGVLSLEPVGRYALRIAFDDLHASGIYSWAYLRRLGDCKFSAAKRYIRELRRRGLSRDPPPVAPKPQRPR